MTDPSSTETAGSRHVFETLASETVFSGGILALRKDQVMMPGGSVVEREVVEHHSAVAVVAIDDRERVVLIDQYRHPLGRRLLELPAGLLDVPGEDPATAAARELAEETGLAAGRWSVLVDVALSPGFMDETLRVYLAQDLSVTEQPDPEHEEADIITVRLPIDEAVRRTLSGEIENATAVAGLLAFAAVRSGGITPRPAGAPWPGRPTAFDTRKAAEAAARAGR
ncbi:NUDIX domain-containing protein [Skermania piniformis]|uniref:NUDIX hydrolase n=1 Tax=Skermania pinensis TaxID=39122 RepID=A0ABX8S5K7_9ACTN|nr:NUDIX hydrolase [Skermania piniformis]QXQ12516.1 NUDIX hydrolase [Skermania piniformis]